MVASCSTFPQSLKCCPDGTPAVIIPPDTLVCPVIKPPDTPVPVAQPVPMLDPLLLGALAVGIVVAAFVHRWGVFDD